MQKVEENECKQTKTQKTYNGGEGRDGDEKRKTCTKVIFVVLS